MNAVELRTFIYEQAIAGGLLPTSREIAARFGGTDADARGALAALKIGKTLIVHPKTGEIWMAGPFSAGRSDYKLSDGTTTWWANCAWDMFGVAILVGRKLLAETKCPDCGETLMIECDPEHPPEESQAVVHFFVPARRWYDDIGFT